MRLGQFALSSGAAAAAAATNGKGRKLMRQEETIDFTLLLDLGADCEMWIREIRKSPNLCRALSDIDRLRDRAWERGIHLSPGIPGLRSGFSYYVRTPALAKAIHDGDTDITALMKPEAIFRRLVDGPTEKGSPFFKRISGILPSRVLAPKFASEPARKPVVASDFAAKLPRPIPLYDRAEARRLTADTGVDYGMIAAGDCAYFVWKAEVEQTRVLRQSVEKWEGVVVERSGAQGLDGDEERELMEQVALMIGNEDNLRAIEAGLIDMDAFIAGRCMAMIRQAVQSMHNDDDDDDDESDDRGAGGVR